MNTPKHVGRLARAAHLLAVGVVLLSSALAKAHAVEIDWQIRNRFRAFDYLPASTDRHLPDGRQVSTPADWFELLAPKPRVNQEPANTVGWLQTVIASGGSPYDDHQRGPWDESTQAYRSDFVDLPQVIPVQVSLKHADNIASGASCQWFLDGTSVASAPCATPQEIKVPAKGGQIEVRAASQVIATAHIEPTLRIVLGLGDSYSAGEGTPDHATVWDPNTTSTSWWSGLGWDIESHIKRPAQWWSPLCNRSFYSFENMTALRMASEDPHAIVSFVHVACAGAEVIDGMLSAQRLPTGHPSGCKSPSKRSPPGTWDEHCDAHDGQLTAAVRLLCRDSSTVVPADNALIDSLGGLLKKTVYGKDQIGRLKELKRCSGELRPIDTILMTMGGNDVGFGGVIATILVPADGRFPIGDYMVNSGRKQVEAVCVGSLPCSAPHAPKAEDRLKDLPARYAAMDTTMRALLHTERTTVVIAQYPNPLRNESGKLCGDETGNNNNAWYAARTALPPITIPKRWEFNVLSGEAAIGESHVVLPLNRGVEDAGNREHWLVARTGDAFAKHGWCVGNFNTLVPPSDATKWDGYADHDRMIRTSDDSFLTQHPLKNDRVDGLGGSFHPNAFGYAAITEGVLHVLPSINRP